MDIEIVRSAYRKLKSHIYYDNTNLVLRRHLASYEKDGNIDSKLEHLAEKIGNYNKNSKYWKGIFSEISSYQLVKNLESISTNTGVISNSRSDGEYKVERINHFIRCPIELHICAAIWTFEVGFRLEPKMAIEPYGNKFNLIKDRDNYRVADGLKSYKPYFGQYQRWRDKAVQAAKDLVDRDKNALVIGLDIKDFYHSVRIDINQVNQTIFDGTNFDEYTNICGIFSELLKRYSAHIGIADKKERVILPIGLISSGILANYYLDPIDRRLSSVLRPDFYGRYVDDILLVTSCPDDQDVSSLKLLADQYLVNTGIFSHKSSGIYAFNEDGFETITIQEEKQSRPRKSEQRYKWNLRLI